MINEEDAMTAEEKVDIHVHMVGTGDSQNGCRVSAEFASGCAFASILDSLRISSSEASDGLIEELLLDSINSSGKIDRSVLLSMDGVYKNSRLLEAQTHLMVSNDYVARLARQNGRVLLGASVHPYRDKKEMLNEVDRCLDAGAVLFYWMPAVQQIDPEDDRCIPFYIRLAREGAPLLWHGGWKFSDTPPDEKTGIKGSLKKMVKALDIGVKVIVAGSVDFDELIAMLTISKDSRWNFYADVSGLSAPEGLFHLERILQEIARGSLEEERILYGSGFPASPAPREAVVPAGPGRSSLHTEVNPLDERYEAARSLGVSDQAFTNAWKVLRPL